MKALAILLVMSLLLLYVWERVELVQIGYKIEQLKKEKIALERERDELRVKVSALASPERIARLAAERLNMIPPQRGQVVLVRVPSDGSSGNWPSLAIRLAKREGEPGVR